MNTHGRKRTNTKKTYTKQEGSSDERKPKVVRKRYNVTPQTAYHIQELAFQEQTTEGRIIDKIMRSYLCDRASKYRNRGYYN